VPAEPLVRGCVLDSSPQERNAGVHVVVVQVGALDQRVGSAGSGRQAGDEAVGERERTAHLTRDRQILDLRDRAPERRLGVVRRGEAEAVPGEVRGEVYSAAVAGAPRRLFQERGYGDARLVRRQRKVARPHVRIHGADREASVQRAPCQGTHPPVDHRADQRVREAHAQVLLHDEQPLALGDRQQLVGVGERLAQFPDGGRSERRHEVQKDGELSGHRVEPQRDRRVQRVRKMHTARSALAPRRGRQRPRELDRVEGIAARDLVDPVERRS
jgi:hypothetical protein